MQFYTYNAELLLVTYTYVPAQKHFTFQIYWKPFKLSTTNVKRKKRKHNRTPENIKNAKVVSRQCIPDNLYYLSFHY